MSYDSILVNLGLSQSMAESFLLYSGIVIVVGFLICVLWQYIVIGFVVFGVFSVILHHPEENISVAKNNTPTQTQEASSDRDENFQKTSFMDPIFMFANLLKLKELSDKMNTPEPEVVVAPVAPVVEKVVETEEMREYVKHCTELTNNSALCRDNWNAVAESGSEIILEPVERAVRKQAAKRAKVEKASVNVDKSFSKVTEVKLLDVDNKEYKERRATALSKPNAVVLQETYR